MITQSSDFPTWFSGSLDDLPYCDSLPDLRGLRPSGRGPPTVEGVSSDGPGSDNPSPTSLPIRSRRPFDSGAVDLPPRRDSTIGDATVDTSHCGHQPTGVSVGRPTPWVLDQTGRTYSTAPRSRLCGVRVQVESTGGGCRPGPKPKTVSTVQNHGGWVRGDRHDRSGRGISDPPLDKTARPYGSTWDRGPHTRGPNCPGTGTSDTSSVDRSWTETPRETSSVTGSLKANPKPQTSSNTLPLPMVPPHIC